MGKLQKYILLLLLLSCNSEKAPDCFQNAGEIIRDEVEVPNFSRITVFEKVALIIKQGDTQKVEIETGEFLRGEVSAVVEGDRLIVRNENGCNLFREYGITTVYVTSPNIVEIRSSTGQTIRSDGSLDYPSLILLSESFIEPEAATTDGEFDLELNSTNVSVTVNGIAYFKLSGAVQNLNLSIAAGDSRIEAHNLIAQNVNLNHRGSNDMLINPQASVNGIIRGTGDVQSFNRPPVIEVEEIFNGRLIFLD
ncbi:DUF2807 domain-containing protein [Costertonia aggregata]|uniref:DUF2807 domain-containing protein n=2 Tax=Costertonia aggregata TaxID=343403 RepID=A0A7H9AUS6_9FLAO|nr:DUF2807 domain-containing protein [Costertonia aggregata]